MKSAILYAEAMSCVIEMDVTPSDSRSTSARPSAFSSPTTKAPMRLSVSTRVGSSLQRPRPPIWFGGNRPGALRRAALLDGWIVDAPKAAAR